MANFYDEYAFIQEGISSGDVTENTLNDEALAIYGLGKGKITVDELNPQLRQEIESKYGLPNFLSSVNYRTRDAFAQMQRGVRQIPGYDTATDLLTGARSAPQEVDLVESGINAAKAAGNIGLGALSIFPSSTVGGALGESAWRASGNVGGETGRTVAELLGQVAGGIPEAAALGKVAGLIPNIPGISRYAGATAARPGLRMVSEAEKAMAPATGIRAIEASPGGMIPELPTVEKAVSKAEQRLTAVHPNVESTPYKQVLREATEDAVRMDKKIIPIGQQADEFVDSLKSEEFRAFSEVITNSLKEEGFSDEAITSFLLKQAKVLYKEAPVTAQYRVDRATVARMVSKIAEKNPELAEKVGVVFRGAPENPQTGLFGRTVEPSPATIERFGPEWHQYETGRKISKPDVGQLDQAGYQTELLKDVQKSPVLTKAEKIKEKVQTYNDLMASQKPGYRPHTLETPDDTSFFMKFQNAIIKSTGLLVTGPGTAVRNLLQQGTRYGLEIPLSAYREILATGSLENAWQKMSAQTSALWDNFGVRDLIEEAKSRLPAELKEQLASRGMAEEYRTLKTPGLWEKGPTIPFTKGKKFSIETVQNAANKVNELQESAFWHANFLASINGDLAPLGLKLGRGATPGQLTEDMITRAAQHANEMTYSRSMSKKVQEAFTNQYNIPVWGIIVNEVAPFARFNYANALRDIIEFSPLGFAKASLAKDAEEAARVMAKSMLGTKMIQQVARLKKDDSTSIWEINIPGLGIVDTRKWHPMSAYAFLGEIINRPPNSPNARVTMEDFASLITGGTRLEDTALGILTSLQDLTPESVGQGIMQTLGQMVARWTTPLKWADAAYVGVTGRAEAMLDRDVMSGKFGGGLFDRAMANVPGLKELLPERIDPTQAEPPGPKSRMDYFLRQTGLEPVRQSYVKQELKRLKFTGPQGEETLNKIKQQLEAQGIDTSKMTDVKSSVSAGDFERKMYAATGNKELNRTMNTLMRDIGRPAMEMVMSSDVYKDMPDPLRRLMADKLLEKLRGVTKKVAVAQGGPGMMIDQMYKELDPVERMVLDYASR